MKSVGVRVLKDNLSKYLNYVKNGEIILVTDHNEVIAELKKPIAKIPKSSKFAMFLSEEEKRGNLTKAASQKQIFLKPPAKLKTKINKDDWWKIYEQVRSDRSL